MTASAQNFEPSLRRRQPSFFESTFSGGRDLRKPSPLIVECEEAGKMLPDDFAVFVALEATGAWIPADDIAVGI